MLEVKGLTKKYGGKSVLRGIDLKVPPGQICILLGPNGAGKSTLIRILCTLARASGGQVMVDGHATAEEPAEARRAIGAVLHETLLYEDLTAAENLRFYSRLFGSSAGEKDIDGMLTKVNLLHRKNDRVGDFSRGMKQRMAIARATVGNPKLMLLDEPFTGLDVRSRDQVSAILSAAAANGTAVLMTAHDPEMAHDLAHRLLVLVDGKVAFDREKSSVSKTDFVAEYRRLAGASR